MNISKPTSLNGYPVIKAEIHPNTVTVMVMRGDEIHNYVVATWWPRLKSQWMWGHYVSDESEAKETFKEVASRNATR